MSDPFEGREFPKKILWATAALLSSTLAVTFYARHTDVGTLRAPDADVLQARLLRFEDAPTGEVLVFDAAATRPFSVVPSGEGGFVRGVLRSLNRARRAQGVDQAEPFTLVRWSDGRFSLEDDATGRRVDVDGFGATNRAAFARLATAPPVGSADAHAETTP